MDPLNTQLALSYQTAMQATNLATQQGHPEVAEIIKSASEDLNAALKQLLAGPAQPAEG